MNNAKFKIDTFSHCIIWMVQHLQHIQHSHSTINSNKLHFYLFAETAINLFLYHKSLETKNKYNIDAKSLTMNLRDKNCMKLLYR